MKNQRYDQLVNRNSGYISEDVQNKIRNAMLLFAGCGIGSQVAISAARMGFCNFILIDGDTIDSTNLNRQAYDFADIGKFKVTALAEKILQINPEARVQVVKEMLTAKNVESLVVGSDLIIDTIDFLDLGGILSLHEMANRYNKPLFSFFSAGWGGCAIYVKPKPEAASLMSQVFGLRDIKSESKPSYQAHFAEFFKGISSFLPLAVQKDMGRVLKMMEDNRPCPASHVVAGSLSVAALGVTCLHRYLSGKDLTVAEIILLDLESLLVGHGLKLG